MDLADKNRNNSVFINKNDQEEHFLGHRESRERREIGNIENSSLRHGLTRVNTDCLSRRGHEGRQDLLFTIGVDYLLLVLLKRVCWLLEK